MSRIIGHLDLDYFYAQVEEVEDPSLKAKPVLVCVFSGRTEDSGVVSTANYKAREFGVRSGMPITLAKRRLKGVDAAFIKMDHSKYEAYSERIMEIVRGSVDILEKAGIDEAFFDITRRSNGIFQASSAMAHQLKSKIFAEEGLTCSIGIGPTRVVAKIASDLKKPDGLTVVQDVEAKAFLSPLPVDKVYGIGPKTASTLREHGVETVGNLAIHPIEKLEDAFGKKLAIYLHDAANCIDEEPLVDNQEVSQLSRIITLKQDTQEVDQIMKELKPALEDVHGRLVSKNLFLKNISVIGIAKNLSSHTKTRTLDSPTNDYATFQKEARELFTVLLQEVGDLRRAGIRLGELTDMSDQRSLAEFTS